MRKRPAEGQRVTIRQHDLPLPRGYDGRDGTVTEAPRVGPVFRVKPDGKLPPIWLRKVELAPAADTPAG